MKNVEEILREIDRLISEKQGSHPISWETATMDIRNLKDFILSGDECEHEWDKQLIRLTMPITLVCKKCGRIMKQE